MKLHKIKNVDLNVCSCEQKIAYNIVSTHKSLIDSVYRIKSTMTENGFSDFVKNTLQVTLDSVSDKYDKQAICQIIEKSVGRYYNLKYHMLTSYKEIGEVFNLK